ncbi:MAG: DUF4350 domain-containing protein [Novosphingobium sp.]|nr:DUF4350 domain-containing protein [Novosphingobium sp.]
MSAASTFSPRAALGLVGIGALAFIALLYAIGAGLTGGGNNGGAHGLSKGLTGYAGLAAMLESTGSTVVRSRNPAALDDPGLLVLTPPHDADGEELAEIVGARRTIGPTLVVLPKWVEIPAQGPEARTGWVALAGTRRARWVGSLGEGLDVELGQKTAQTLAIAKEAAIPLIRDDDARAQVAYLNDDGSYPELDDWSGWAAPDEPDEDLFPVVIVAEPDLLSNRGMADKAAALAALDLVRAAKEGADGPVTFDVTLNGLDRARNLLTLAFTPPFLAATLALLLAALAIAWRGFIRFGPPRVAGRTVAYGKTALVENSAGLIRRAGRIRLLGAPYAALVAQRTLRALGLPAGAELSAIDAAQARRGLTGGKFSAEAAALAAARKPADLVRHAAALQTIKKGLSR